MTRRVLLGVSATVGAGIGVKLVDVRAAGRVTQRDPRLETRVNTAQVGVPLKEFAQVLTRTTGVMHEVSPQFDEKTLVALNLTAPLWKAHHGIATAFVLSWTPGGAAPPRYRLERTVADERKRAQALDAARQRAVERLKRRIDYAKRLAFLPAEKLKPLADSGDQYARAMLHPNGWTSSRLMFQLPERAWNEFWEKGSCRVAIRDLAPKLQELAIASAGDTSVRREDNQESYRVKDLVVPHGFIVLQSGGTLDRPTIWGCQRYANHGQDTNLLYAEGWSREPPEVRRQEILANPSRVPDDPRFRQKVSLRDRPERRKATLGERPRGASPLAELIEQLADQIDLPIIADCEYRRRDEGWLAQQWWLAADIHQQPLAKTLDLLSADFEYEWRHQATMIVLRPRRWYAPPGSEGYRYPKVPMEIPKTQ